ncbi:hypothetical protein C8J56DRAFT_1037351 [Mycena floridula]|nr:hypothetical protein C8J56DRAFT_1037351 [Mycena floridula]
MDSKTLWDDYGVIDGIMPFTHGFPGANIHELLSSDLLHQLIKGTFKDHLVTWVSEYLEIQHGQKQAKEIMADIDHQIAAVPSFPGLHRFPEGHGFKQWTGDDSKALMKVYLPAIPGHVLPAMVQAIGHFLEFCHIVRHNMLDEDSLQKLDTELEAYHTERMIFIHEGVCPSGISLPHQHSMSDYR